MDLRTRDPTLGLCPEIPTVFSSLEEARNSLDYHWNGCIRVCNRENVRQLTGSEADRQRYLKVFRDWRIAFEAFLKENVLDARSMQGARVLQMSQAFAIVSVHTLSGTRIFDETEWDHYLHDFDRIVTLAEETSSNIDFSDDSQTRPLFFLDMNLVMPLYAVAHKCRDPSIRRRAVSLLKSSPRQEGIWDSILAARAAEKIISIEENGLGVVQSCHDVPESSRIRAVSVQFDMEGRLGTIRYSRQGTGFGNADVQGGSDTDYVETVEW
ncbi:MAG: hypothetical protein Q9164_005975 [Protoblastenia rupestris]